MMCWSKHKDIVMMREAGAQGVFQTKQGSRERGNMWQVGINNLNALHEGFEVTARSMRDRFGGITKRQKSKTLEDLMETSLGGEEQTEYELLLEDLMEQSAASEQKAVEQTEADKAAADADR